MGDWKDQTGLSKSTKVAKIYVQEDIKEEWKREAEERGLSLSKHLRYTVQKARYLREKGRFKFLLKLLIPTELKSRMYERRIRGTSFESSNPS